MKRKLWVPLIIAGLLAVFCLGFLAAGMVTPRSYRELPRGKTASAPAQAAESITLVYEGTYPGFSDVPVSAKDAAPSRRVIHALNQQKYTWAFPLLRPRDEGLAIYELTGCTPECVAYWDGRYLWLPKNYNGRWRGYAPSSPEELDRALRNAG